jgi:8-oxo-dGTP pyrophosphatase MutT (NUDIX family)
MRGSPATPRQAAAIPIRRAEGGLQICLIRRKDRSSWSVPKGYIERGDDWGQAALGEADEEAGLYGRILGEAIGTYDYEKGPMTLTVVVGVMEVLEERATWQEMRWRERRWCSIEEAGSLLKDHMIWPLYERFRQSRGDIA